MDESTIKKAVTGIGIAGTVLFYTLYPQRPPEQEAYIRYVGLQNTVQSGSPERVASLLAEGVPPDPPAAPHGDEFFDRAYDTMTPLQNAAYAGDAAIVGLLLAAGADPDLQCCAGESALYYAARRGHSEVIRVLLDAGADAALSGPDGSPSAVAAANGHERIASLLASRQPPPR